MTYNAIATGINDLVLPYGCKYCAGCDKIKALNCFAPDKRNKTCGKQGRCRDCNHAATRPAAKRYERQRRRKQTISGRHTAEQWAEVLARYNYQCLCCGSMDNIQKDHVMPIAMDGTDNIDNLQPLCATCNNRKGARYIDYRG